MSKPETMDAKATNTCHHCRIGCQDYKKVGESAKIDKTPTLREKNEKHGDDFFELNKRNTSPACPPASLNPPQLPEDDVRIVSRSHSTATTGASSACPTTGSGEMDAEGSPASRAVALDDKLPSPQQVASPSPVEPPRAPPSSRASSTASSLNYSTDSDPPQSPLGLSPLHRPPSPSRLKPDDSRRSTEIRATNAPEAPMSPPLNYRGVDRHKKNKKGQDKAADSNRRNPIFSLFGRLGSGATRSRIQDGSSAESSPSVVHMGEDKGLDGDDIYDGSLEEGRQQQQQPPKLALGRTTGGGTGVRTVAKVVDVHAAFGLAKRDDDDDEEIAQYRSTGFLGGLKKKKKTPQSAAAAAAPPGIGGYGSVLSSCSSSPDSSNDLAEAARAIPRPLFGDSSRAVGRQNARGILKNSTSVGASSEAGSAFSTNNTAAGNEIGGGGNAAAPGGHSLDLADAYGLDLAEEGGGSSDGEPSPPPKTSTVNPLFGDSGGGGRVKAMARAFDAEAQAQAVSAGRVAVDNNNIGLPGRVRKKRGGKKKKGGGGGSAALNRLESSGSALQSEVFTISEAEEEEEEDDDGENNDENV